MGTHVSTLIYARTHEGGHFETWGGIRSTFWNPHIEITSNKTHTHDFNSYKTFLARENIQIDSHSINGGLIIPLLALEGLIQADLVNINKLFIPATPYHKSLGNIIAWCPHLLCGIPRKATLKCTFMTRYLLHRLFICFSRISCLHQSLCQLEFSMTVHKFRDPKKS